MKNAVLSVKSSFFLLAIVFFSCTALLGQDTIKLSEKQFYLIKDTVHLECYRWLDTVEVSHRMFSKSVLNLDRYDTLTYKVDGRYYIVYKSVIWDCNEAGAAHNHQHTSRTVYTSEGFGILLSYTCHEARFDPEFYKKETDNQVEKKLIQSIVKTDDKLFFELIMKKYKY